jgi:predicted HNH restriction endonuclease
MYRNNGKLRWYQSPTRINEILAYVILVKENQTGVRVYERSSILKQINGKVNLSDWCVGVMEGFNIVIKNDKTKELYLTKDGEELYLELVKAKNLYSHIKDLIDKKYVGRVGEDSTRKFIDKNIAFKNYFKNLVLNSEQFYNASVFLISNGLLTKQEFKEGFWAEMLFLYNGEVPITESNTATSADNRIPFIYQIGDYLGLFPFKNSKIHMTKQTRVITTTNKKKHVTKDLDDVIVNEIDNVRVSRSIAILNQNDIDAQNSREPEKYDKPIGSKIRYKTNPRISKTALKEAKYKCEYAENTKEIHLTFGSKYGHQYTEAHHLIPMHAQGDFLPINLDRTENIVSLCPICHSAIHYGSKAERERVLKILYDMRIKILKTIDSKLDISFNDLMRKYYK